MNNAEQSYRKVELFINNCETFFDLKCADAMVELFGHFFKDDVRAKEVLKDLKADQYQKIFNYDKDKIHP